MAAKLMRAELESMKNITLCENVVTIRSAVNAAAEALQATDETVLTIASRCGFENLSYFNRAFKAHFGMTPREYRKK